MELKGDVLKIKLEHGILHITLNRPQTLNALNQPLLMALAHNFEMAKQNPAVKALLITGEGKAFCVGADINQLASLNSYQGLLFAEHGQKIFRSLEQLGKPSLAAIQGFALGGGCELAMAATLRIATDTAMFGQPEVKLGVIPGFGGTQRLSRLIGKGRALDLCLTGRSIPAQEAFNFGLINEIVAKDALLTRSFGLLQQLIGLPPIALQSVMKVIDYGYDLSLEEALELEAAHFAICCGTKDKNEGVQAFLDKRSGVFTGE